MGHPPIELYRFDLHLAAALKLDCAHVGIRNTGIAHNQQRHGKQHKSHAYSQPIKRSLSFAFETLARALKRFTLLSIKRWVFEGHRRKRPFKDLRDGETHEGLAVSRDRVPWRPGCRGCIQALLECLHIGVPVLTFVNI
jgi:hypothetical protein